MRYLRIFICIAALILGVFGQEARKQDYTIKVGVEEVRIDAVVLGKDGRSVADLNADDFEVYQDGALQKIVSCNYIDGSVKIKAPIASPEASKAELLVSKPKPKIEDVRRAIAFMVKSYGADPRPHLRKFVESQMVPGDMVCFLGLPIPPTFSSDKRELLAKIQSIQGRFSCVEAAIGMSGFDSLIIQSLPMPSLDSLIDTRTDEDIIRALEADVAPIRYAIRALQDMPGRKYLVLTQENIFSDARKLPKIQARIMNAVSDEAWRAGVVVSTWDYCNTQIANPFGKFNILFKKTGGIYTDNNNFMYKGQPALDVLSGYYLLSYIPPANTFGNKRLERYHPIKVNVKRPGVKVLNRDGFYGKASGSSNFAAVPKINTLQQAIFSPMLHDEIKLYLSSGYAYDDDIGYFLRSWMHLDGKDLTFKKENDGVQILLLEMQALTSNSNGIIQDTKKLRYEFRLSDADIVRIKKDGIDLKTYLPVQSPGYYYVSVAIQDKTSGKIGTSYQFLDISDLSKPRLSLSNIFTFSDRKDALILKSGNILDDEESFNSMQSWKLLRKSPALRTYKPGETFEYMMFVYNAVIPRSKTPVLQFQATIFKDGLIYSQDPFEDISLDSMDKQGRIPIVKRLVFSNNTEDGDYILQLVVTDKSIPKRPRNAVRGIDFKIRKD
jgi:VWFA-related protein